MELGKTRFLVDGDVGGNHWEPTLTHCGRMATTRRESDLTDFEPVAGTILASRPGSPRSMRKRDLEG
jgi:hypothetical protein